MSIVDNVANILGPQWIEGKNKLYAGCGKNKIPGWINLDGYAHQNPDVIANLNSPLPFIDSSFDVILCSHTLEHVDNTMFTMYEFNRVLRVGGHLIVVFPYGFSDVGMCNPLHKHFFSQ